MARRRAIAAACLAAVLGFGGASAHGQETRPLSVSAAWTRAIGAGAPTAAGYLTIRNGGAAPDRLLAATSEAAARVEIHEMDLADGVMRMRPLPGGIELPPGAEVRLAPGGLHLMLVGPSQPFVQGGRVPLTLVFERAGRIQVELLVAAPGARDGGR